MSQDRIDTEYRAALTKRGLSQLAEEDRAVHDRVLTLLGEALRQRLAAADDATWIPFEDHLAVIDAIRAELGDEGFQQFCRRGMKAMWDLPFLEPLLSGVVQLLGVTPETLLRLSARGWMTSFRRGGQLVYETLGLPNCGVLSLRGFPPEHLASGTFELSIAGCFEAYFDLCKTEGEVSVSEEPGEVRFIFRWR